MEGIPIGLAYGTKEARRLSESSANQESAASYLAIVYLKQCRYVLYRIEYRVEVPHPLVSVLLTSPQNCASERCIAWHVGKMPRTLAESLQ